MSKSSNPIAAQLVQTTPVTEDNLPPYLVAALTYLCNEG